MDHNNIINQFISNLDKHGFNSSLLKSELFDFNQKFVLYNAIRSCAKLELLANPTINAYAMEEMLDEQRAIISEMQQYHGIDPEHYTISQILELNDALAHKLDITHYKSHKYSAEHMYVAKTFQIEKLNGLDKITPVMDILDVVQLRDNARWLKNMHTKIVETSLDSKSELQLVVSTNEDVLKYFEQYDKNNAIKKWREDGKINTSDNFHYLDNENPERVMAILNQEFKTDVQLNLNHQQRSKTLEIASKTTARDFEI